MQFVKGRVMNQASCRWMSYWSMQGSWLPRAEDIGPKGKNPVYLLVNFLDKRITNMSS
jgi:hypothetical protein